MGSDLLRPGHRTRASLAAMPETVTTPSGASALRVVSRGEVPPALMNDPATRLHLVVSGNSVGTRMLVGRVTVWKGVKEVGVRDR